MKDNKDIKVPNRFTNSKQVPKARTPINHMGEEILVPPKENLSNENRVKIVNQKHKDKQKSLIAKTKTKSKQKTKNK